MVDIRRAGPGELEVALGELTALLDERYGPAPWRESPQENAREARHVVDAAAQPGAVTAVAVDGGRLLGIAHGAPGDTFLADLRAADPDAATAWPAPVFELRQLVLTASATGRGIGGRLHDEVMRAVRLPALLLTHPGATAALGLYARRGWVTLAETSFGPADPRVVLGRGPGGEAGPPT